ncbi:30S ribosomal protein S6 alpha, chloroplastic [Sesamum angolense]|uniref:30S ribosomal protein S6 alpha, chloroplastic n=1 Tax=Sesamum angolense TaxID=2727404 RepID=A0AAE1WS92_9LAMI|nr:30S ribosomal protein S6 alpha, chloroplastic [Sesamum angolense]
MASASLSSSALMVSKPPLIHPHSSSPALLCPWNNPIRVPLLRRSVSSQRTASAVKSEFDIAFFERDLAGSDAPPTPTIPGAGFPDVDDKEEPQCPPGLRKYETMVVLRPDMSEDERLAFTQKYEEGVIPLAYSIRKKNKAGESNTYLDGIYLLFTYFTKPESMTILNETLLADDDVIRSSSFKIRKRKF